MPTEFNCKRINWLFLGERSIAVFCQQLPEHYRSNISKGHSLMNDPMTLVELGQFIKLVGAAATGGQAKHLIQSGFVLLNGEEETRRRKKLIAGDRVTVDDRTWIVPSSYEDMASAEEVLEDS